MLFRVEMPLNHQSTEKKRRRNRAHKMHPNEMRNGISQPRKEKLRRIVASMPQTSNMIVSLASLNTCVPVMFI
jgi:hypothetical protein